MQLSFLSPPLYRRCWTSSSASVMCPGSPHWAPKHISSPEALQTGVPDALPSAVQGGMIPFLTSLTTLCQCKPAEQFTFAAWRQSTAWYPALLTRTHPFLQSCSLARQAGPGQCEGLSCPKSRTWPGSCQRTPVASAEPHGYSCLLSCVNLHSDTSHMPFVQQLWIWYWCPRAWTHSWVTLLKVDCYPL